ncbi:hypothetical protein [Leptospira alexanderi]|uniref:hypothetical protein n=1 Tax=Leptospira alexanderi TaxID=100053 RepID=UPI000990A041|nr:hypothetical protein [Leptospira alexanderi]
MRFQNGIYKSNILVSFAGLNAGGFENTEFAKTSLTLRTGATANKIDGAAIGNYYYDSDKLSTVRIGYTGEILPWHESKNKFLANLGFRFGAELNGNSTQFSSNYNIR